MFAAAILAATVGRIRPDCRPPDLSRRGDDPYAPIRIAVEGTTYMACKGMRRSLDAWLHTMLADGMPRPYVMAPVDQASLLGAAVAALGRLG
jgi:hexokinase